ncbi:hypothetical protein TNIN_356931 [Trichonephila inaurata madagascariensis]|uniref:Uncharacterized protein n=2 Tax=Entelegynae TaxID=74971 RepID=A0A8X6I8T1_9ARAC|nr:hypothetical protein TNIN_356931 [Trichonephila inaurata madagascariensis]
MLFYLVGYPKNVLNVVGSFPSSTSSSLHLLISSGSNWDFTAMLVDKEFQSLLINYFILVILLGILWILYFGYLI